MTLYNSNLEILSLTRSGGTSLGGEYHRGLRVARSTPGPNSLVGRTRHSWMDVISNLITFGMKGNWMLKTL